MKHADPVLKGVNVRAGTKTVAYVYIGVETETGVNVRAGTETGVYI